MKLKTKIGAILLGLSLVASMSFADGTKCGTGGDMKAKTAKCGGDMNQTKKSKCGGDMKAKTAKCGGDMKAKKNKCGGDSKEKKSKCGSGKCGS